MTKLNKQLLLGAVAAAIAGITVTAQAEDKAEGKEKCYGVAKAGKNDCASGANSCAGTSTKDSAADAFIAVPKGMCEKLVGGSTTPTAK